MVWKVINSMTQGWSFKIVALWFGVLLGHYLWPTGWWMDVNRVFVDNKHFDNEEPIVMEVERVIHRPFLGQWTIHIYKQDTSNGKWAIFCTAGPRTVPYRSDATYPTPLTLRWWTDGECPKLPRGTYFITTTWTILNGFFFDKHFTVTSNQFIVGSREGPMSGSGNNQGVR